MATSFRPYEPAQMLLLASDLRDWLPPGHLAHHVSDLVDALDLTAFYAPYEEDGRRNAPYEPRMMVKVLLYGYATGVFSSRGIARKLEEEVEVLLSTARDTDVAEDARFGEAFRGDELPQELHRREDRLAAIRAAKARLEARQRKADDARGRKPGMKRNPKGGRPYKREYGEPDEKAQDNFTDPESRIMKTSQEGFQQCYNAQVAVEGGNQLIVATEVSSNASDQGHRVALLDAVETAHGECPKTVLADAGYCNEADLVTLEGRGVDGHVALGREGRRAVAADATKHPAKARMAAKLSTDAGRVQYAQRKWLSEAPNGWIKQALGFRRFSLRGLDKVRGEWDLVCLALNIRRMRGLQAA